MPGVKLQVGGVVQARLEKPTVTGPDDQHATVMEIAAGPRPGSARHPGTGVFITVLIC